MPSMSLCMIVRNEGAVIQRCIESVRPLIDSWVICDTGSTDGTPELAAALLSEVPGELHRREWRNFGSNRTELMELAQGSAEYLLLLDADMTLRRESDLPPLTADAYLLRHTGPLDYAVPRLVSGARRWRFEGSTHEYLTSERPYTQELLTALVVEHHADGGSRATKLERDAVLLEQDLEREPEDARAVFYLAQTYRDLGDFDRAIALYRRRVALGGWDEEVFYAALQVGVLLAGRRDPAALPALLDAWHRRPARAEPLYEAARFARTLGWHEAAEMFARRGLELEYPHDDLLFVDRSAYTWGLRFELAIACYWVGKAEESLALNDELLRDGSLPSEIESAVIENRSFSARAIGGNTRAPRRRARLDELTGGMELGRVQLDVEPDWPQFNPTIAASEDGFRMIVRTASYLLDDGVYRFLSDDQVIETINYVVDLDADLRVRAVNPLRDASPEAARFPSRVRGYEDCRLVQADGRWLATATVRDRNASERCETALLEIDGDVVRRARPLTSPFGEKHEKNWMPFVLEGHLHVLYSCAPTVVLRCDQASAACEVVSDEPGPAAAVSMRGGSQGLPLPDGFLFVTHTAAGDGRDRSYGHHFVLLDRDLRLAALSPEFTFTGEPIEFCAGLAPHGERLVLTFGVGDREAMVALVDLDEALGLLEPA